MWLVVIIIAIIIFAMAKKTKDTENVTNGKRDDDINKLLMYYEATRNNVEALGANVIGISTFWFELDGKISSSSGYMSVCVNGGTNDALAKRLGMDVKTIEGEKYYQFVIRKHFSTTEKREVLRKLVSELSARYDNDAFQFDETIPAIFSMVDQKDFINLINQINQIK